MKLDKPAIKSNAEWTREDNIPTDPVSAKTSVFSTTSTTPTIIDSAVIRLVIRAFSPAGKRPGRPRRSMFWLVF